MIAKEKVPTVEEVCIEIQQLHPDSKCPCTACTRIQGILTRAKAAWERDRVATGQLERPMWGGVQFFVSSAEGDFATVDR